MRLICTEGSSRKFWHGSVEGKTLIVCFGRLDTEGQEQRKSFGSPAAAVAELNTLVAQKRRKGYADEGGKGGKGGGKGGGKSGGKASGKGYVFYGRHAGDWHEGANFGHPFEVRFRDVPKNMALVARAFEASLLRAEVAEASEWKWQGAWASFCAGERKVGEGAQFVDDLAKAFDAVHAVAALDHVAFLGMTELKPGKSEARLPPRQEAPGGGRWKKDPTFEAVREEIRHQASARVADEVVRTARKKGTIAFETIDAKRMPRPSKTDVLRLADGGRLSFKYRTLLRTAAGGKPKTIHLAGWEIGGVVALPDDYVAVLTGPRCYLLDLTNPDAGATAELEIDGGGPGLECNAERTLLAFRQYGEVDVVSVVATAHGALKLLADVPGANVPFEANGRIHARGERKAYLELVRYEAPLAKFLAATPARKRAAATDTAAVTLVRAARKDVPKGEWSDDIRDELKGRVVRLDEDDDDQLVVSQGGRTLLRWRLPDSESHFMSVAWAEGGRIAAKGDEHLMLLSAKGKLLAKAPISMGQGVTAIHQGRVLVACGNDGWQVFGINGDRMVLLQKLVENGYEVLTDRKRERCFVKNDAGEWLELRGALEAWKAAFVRR